MQLIILMQLLNFSFFFKEINLIVSYFFFSIFLNFSRLIYIHV